MHKRLLHHSVFHLVLPNAEILTAFIYLFIIYLLENSADYRKVTKIEHKQKDKKSKKL